MPPWFKYPVLLLCIYVSIVCSLDCNEPSVVIECLYDPESGESCGLRLEQSFRLFDVRDSKVIKVYEWLDETAIREEVDAVKDLRSYLKDIVGTNNISYDDEAYALYICRFHPFSCTRAIRYRRGSYVNDTTKPSISKMEAARESMRARWALICHKMVWLEQQSAPKPTLWRDVSTETVHCVLRSPVPWKYNMEMSSRDIGSISGIATFENNMTVYQASVKARPPDETSVLHCIVRFRTGTVWAMYLREYQRFLDDHRNAQYLLIFCFVFCIAACIVMLVE